MFQTKLSVIYRKLWGQLKFGDNSFDTKTSWKTFSNEWQTRHWTKFKSLLTEGNRSHEEDKIKVDTTGICNVQQLGRRSYFNTITTVQNYQRENIFHYNDPHTQVLGKNLSTGLSTGRSGVTESAQQGKSQSDTRRARSSWIRDRIRRKQETGSFRSTLEVQELGKIEIKEKLHTEGNETNEKSSIFKSRKLHDVCENECPDETTPTKSLCSDEEAGQAQTLQCNELSVAEHPSTSETLCPTSSDVKNDHTRKNKKLGGFNFSNFRSGKKYRFGASTSSTSSLPSTCTNSRSTKGTTQPNCPQAPKRTPANSLSRNRSSVPSPPLQATNSTKCPALPMGPVTCKKPTVPCQTQSPTPPPSPASSSTCSQSSCPQPKNRCGSPPCPPPPCPSQCPPPPPPPCCPPPCCPKMEALQFDPVCKTLNFYMLNAPTSIRKDEVLVQVVYSGVNGTDMMIMEGQYPTKCSPVILGHEFSGIACAVGSGVSHIKCGDCIAVDPYTACHVCRYCTRGQFGACSCEGLNNSIGIHKDGGWAEFVVVHKNQVHAIPKSLSLAQAVLVRQLSCVVYAMSNINIPFGSDIVIQGTGISGCLWASTLHMQGHKNVIACDVSEYKRKLFQCLDLKYCILPPEKMCNVKADIVIDCTGSGKSIERGVKILNQQGQLCIFGTTAPIEELSIKPFEITKKEAKIISITTNQNSFSKAITLADMMGCRYLDYEKLGMQTFKLGQYEGAIKMKRNEEICKIVFKIQNSK